MSWPASSAASSFSFGPCAKGTEFQCTRLSVPLDRTGALSGTISLAVERRLAGPTPSHTAVVGLAGGPGQAANPFAEDMAKAISPALGSRDLLVFDQRGTGESGALSCAALSGSAAVNLSPFEITEHCARELGPARGDYTTSESVADIEALREAGGYEKLVLYGTSYGTKVALDYAERYPQNVEALVLDSTETPSGPESFHLSTFKAMTPVLRELCSRDACTGVSATPVADLARLAARLSAKPVTARVYLPNGKSVTGRVTSRELYELLLAGDFNPALRAETPAAIHGALDGDAEPLLRLLVLGGLGASDEVDGALFDATTCEETPFPWSRTASLKTREAEVEAALEALPPADFYPFNAEAGLLDQSIPTCISWPDAAPPPPGEAALPDVPTLILSGGQDLRTPTGNALAVAKLIPDAQVLVVPYTGHSVIGSDFTSCTHLALTAFFAGTAVNRCPNGKNDFPPVALAPSSLAAVPSTRGVAGPPGKALTAAVDSIRDLEHATIILGITAGKPPAGAQFGGLRGGYARVTKTNIILTRYSYIPGIQISGTISNSLLFKSKGASATLLVTGSSAASGQLRLSTGHHFSGVLDGQPFSVQLTATTASRSQASGEEDWLLPVPSYPSLAHLP